MAKASSYHLLTIKGGKATVRVHSPTLAFTVEALPVGGGRPVTAHVSARALRAGAAPLVLPPAPPDALERALKLAGLKEQDGAIALRQVTRDPGVGTRGKLTLSVKSASTAVIAIKYVGGHAQTLESCPAQKISDHAYSLIGVFADHTWIRTSCTTFLKDSLKWSGRH